jgi:isopentenyl phosphate kinase
LAELVFVKLGGSLITDKNLEATARPEVIRRLAAEVRRALDRRGDLHLVLGHGSGSFGHVVAQRYHVQSGVTDWRGYAETGAAATRLNRMVTDIFLEAGVPVVSIQPSASARCRGGTLQEMAVHPIEEALQHGLVPLVYGDVALDDLWGTTIISTETIFAYLARLLSPKRVLLVGDVGGVYSSDPHLDAQAHLVPLLRVSRIEQVQSVLGGSHGVDVTGGMHSKVWSMVDLVCAMPTLQVALLSGLEPGLLERALEDATFNPGTWITS